VRRRLFNLAFTLAAAVSLVLCVATVVMWVRSYWVIEGYQMISVRPLPNGQLDRRIFVWRWTTGAVYFGRTVQNPGSTDVGSRWEYYRLKDESSVSAFWTRRLGFDWVRQPNGGSLIVALPYPLLVLATGIPMSFLLLRLHRKRRRSSLNLCPICGYDLRATPERCPECGTAASLE